jgi:hypothetical protein
LKSKNLIIFIIILLITFGIINKSFAAPLTAANVESVGFKSLDKPSGIDEADEDLNNSIKVFLDEYRGILAVLTGFGVLTSLLAFILNFIRLGAVAEKPVLRRKIAFNLLTDGILLTILGSFTLILTIFYSIIFG